MVLGSWRVAGLNLSEMTQDIDYSPRKDVTCKEKKQHKAVPQKTKKRNIKVLAEKKTMRLCTKVERGLDMAICDGQTTVGNPSTRAEGEKDDMR